LVHAASAKASSTEPPSSQARGALFTLTNDASGNEVLAFRRDADGQLSPAGRYPTGGRGSGDGLGSQGSLVLSADGEFLFAVDAGSNEISSFAVRGARLSEVGHVSSGGLRPISLTVHNDLLFVLNAGGDGNITGFIVNDDGSLANLKDSTRPLSGANVNPAQVEFTPDGENLIVTEKDTNSIDTYIVDDDGLAEGPLVNKSSGETPFGFEFGRRSALVVSEAFGGAPGASALSSYRVADDELSVVSPSIANQEDAACWVSITRDGRTAFTTNTGNGTVSSYRILRDGSLELINGVAANTGEGSAPIDMAMSGESRFLYVLLSGRASIGAFRIQPAGDLEEIPGVSDLPRTVVGLAAR
jgi:6-phosphogluconolactonase (cycloisomerase 2 family)